MRGDELLDVLGYVDPALIEQADRSTGVPWLRRLVGAACLIVAFVLGMVALNLSNQRAGDVAPEVDTPTVLDAPTMPVTPTEPQELLDLIEHKVYPQPLTGVQVLGTPTSGESSVSSGTQGVPLAYEYRYKLMVEGKIIEVLPDVYTEPLSLREYRILRVQTLDDILNQNFPREFYLRIDKRMSTDLEQYDSLIFSLKQVGIEDFLLCNRTAGVYETFTLLFELDSTWYSSDNTVLAYTDGVLDASLWELPGWSLGTHVESKILEDGYYQSVPAKAGCSPEDTKAIIREKAPKDKQRQGLRVETQADFPENTVFDYVKPFENGIFAQEYSFAGGVTYSRIINGFATNEHIVVQGKTVIRSGETFTAEDLLNLPDLGGFLARLNLETLQQPNGEYYQDLDVWQHCYGAAGMYAKVDGEVYGIVKVTWHFIENGTCGRVLPEYYDAIYYLVQPDGSYQMTTYEQLRRLVGGDGFLVKPTPVSEIKQPNPYE